MATRIPAATVKRLRERTGATLAACKRALQAHSGDEDKAEAQLRTEEALEGDPASLRNQFLVAMPGLEDDNFSHTVSLMCEHNDKGAIGLIIN
ncbi:MAG: YqgE/AlgH family protein, partial [Panacagrimonas sp.]